MSQQSTKLDPETHLLLDQPLLRLSHELLRKTFKSSQKLVERETTTLLSSVKDLTIKASNNQINAAAAGQQLESMMNRIQGLKRKLEALHGEEKQILAASKKRISHLQDLYNVSSLVDVGYDSWSRIRFDRLLVDYLLRNGYGESANQLANEKGIQDLVDMDVFVQASRVEESLRKGRSTTECLSWCVENKVSLRKIKSNLEFELRLQQYIELVREGKQKEAIIYSKKFLAAHHESHLEEITKAAALLAYPPDTQVQPYKDLYAPARWDHLAQSFISTLHSLYNLPSRPLLHIALSAGLSCLKTPACHSSVVSSSGNTASSGSSLCPICSTELNSLARNVPYAHHVRSSVDPDPVVLPNGRIYGRSRLDELSNKLGLLNGTVRDPTTGEQFDETQVRKVFIS